MYRFFNIFIKTIGWLIVVLLTALVLAVYAMQLPLVQTALAEKVTIWLTEKLGSSVTIGSVRMSWFDNVTLEDVNIKDLKGRDMISVPEVYVDFKTNFSFTRKEKIKFDNNLDYVMLNRPELRLIREEDGLFNVDYWIEKVQFLINGKGDPNAPEHNIPFTIDDSYIQDGKFTMIDGRKTRFPKNEFDYYNFTLNKISGNIKNFFVQGDTITLVAKEVTAIDKRSDLEIKNLSTDFFYSRQQMLLKELNAKINNSELRNFIGFYYDSPQDFNDFNARVKMKANLVQCNLDAQDLARFAPELYAYKEIYNLNGDLSGVVNNFGIENLVFNFGKSSFLKGKASFKGLPELKETRWNFDLTPSVITAEDARQYAGENYYDEYVKMFGKVDFKGQFDGFYNDFTTNAVVKSSELGEVRGKIAVKLNTNPENSTYFGDVVTNQLNLGKLLDMPELLQKITFDGLLDGKGLTIPSAQLHLEGDVRQIDFNNYNYQNIALNGKMQKSVFEGLVEIFDPNLQGELSGIIDFTKDQNKFDFRGKIKDSNLKHLGLTTNNVRFQSELFLNVSGNTLDSWLGNAVLSNVSLADSLHSFKVDNFFLYSNATKEERELALVSDFFDINLKGNFIPSQAISDVSRLTKEYLLFFNDNDQEDLDYYASTPIGFFSDNYVVNYEVNFKKSDPFFAYFYPEIQVSPNAKIHGSLLQASNSEFTLVAKADSARYGTSMFYGNSFSLNTTKVAAQPEVEASWNIRSSTQKFGEKIETENLIVKGFWDKSNTIAFNGEIKQQDSNDKLLLDGKLKLLSKGIELSFNPETTQLSLLDDVWKIAKDNEIFISGDDISFSNVELSHLNQQIELNGKMSSNPLDLSFITVNNFDLKTLNSLTAYSIGGVLDGQLALQDIYKNPLVSSNLKIVDFQYEKQQVGNITASTEWDNSIQKLQIKADVVNDKNTVFGVSGTYDPNNVNSALDLEATFKATPLLVFQGFVKDVFSNIGGSASGTVAVKGSLKSPELNGEILINNGRLRIDVLNSYLYFTDKIIVDKSNYIAPPDGIKLTDAPENGNIATLQGGVYTDKNGQFRLGISATMNGTNGFQLMNTTLKDNEYFFGTANVGGNLQLTGDFSDITIAGNLTSKRNTKLVIPLDGSTTVNTDIEAIPFLNRNQEIVYDLKSNTADSVLAAPPINLSGVKMAFNLALTPAAECEIIFDRTNNDKLVARGNGRLTIEYDTRGGFSINGPYEVESGKYDFSFQNLSSLRKFDIEKGSRIEWSGDPYTAEINLQTSYTTNLSIEPIVGTTTTSTTRYPAKVTVNLTKDLMHPTISFGMKFVEQQLPISYRPQILAFEERLRNDEQLLSRNVSSILAFNQILFGTNEVGVLTQQFLIDNISNLVSNQIGNIASKIDPNFELGLQLGDIRQNFNNTQLNVAYRYNDRLRFKGRSFYSNGSVANITNNQTQLTVGGEVEYLLSNDGTWSLTAYSRSVPYTTYFLNNATGSVIVSGMNLQFSRNFNSIFSKKKSFPKGASETTIEKDISMK